MSASCWDCADQTESSVGPRVLVGTLCMLNERANAQSSAGKTLLAKTLAKVLDVPFSVSDATTFTQVSHSKLWGAAEIEY